VIERMAKELSAECEAPLSPLRRRSVRALHEQLSDRLRVEYTSSYRAGEQIPTEEEIQRIHGVSRVTVRRAIQTLVDRGILIRRQGKGTFLAGSRSRILYPIDRFGPFTDALVAAEEPVRVTLLDFRWIEAPLSGFEAASGPALVYERLYEAADGSPHALLRIMLPAEIGEKVSRAEASEMGIYQILQDHLAITPMRAEFHISSELPDALLANKLRISPSTPLLILDRRSFDRRGRVVERTIHYLLPEVYKLSVNVRRPPTTA
jgi:GntR family transcriptional regulator